MGRLLFIVIALGAFIGIVAPSLHTAATPAPHLVATTSEASAETPPPRSTVAVTSGFGELVLDRDPTGHFNTQATVNGQSIPFVVDTGADVVALTVDDARRIGLTVDPSRFTVIAQGASGPVRGEELTIDRIELNGQTIQHVRGAVLEGLATNLLGQSALAQLGEVEMKGDKMVLR